MLLKVEKDVRGGICYAILRYAKVNTKIHNNYDKINNYDTLSIGT